MKSTTTFYEAFYLLDCPDGPSKAQIEQALQPSPIRIDDETWAEAERKFSERNTMLKNDKHNVFTAVPLYPTDKNDYLSHVRYFLIPKS